MRRPVECAIASIIGNAGAPNTLYRNDGDGVFTPDATVDLGSGTTTALALGDLNGDDALDLIVGTEAANRLYLNDGKGVFTLDAAADHR